MTRSRKRRRPVKRYAGVSKSGRTLVFVLGTVLVFVGVLTASLWPRCDPDDVACPSAEALERHVPAQATHVLDSQGGLLGRLSPVERVVVTFDQIPPPVWKAFVAVEDRRYFQHDGVDYRRIAGALAVDVWRGGFRQGFSTIPMQLLRNVFPGAVGREKSLRRKLWEVVLSTRISRSLSKERLLTLYLNEVYLGAGLYGVDAAARGYFGKPLSALDWAEIAVLAGLPKSPQAYNPREHPEEARARRDVVLRVLVDAGLVEPAEGDRLRRTPVTLAQPQVPHGSGLYFLEAVRKELVSRFGPQVGNGGYRVETTLDPSLQQAAEAAVVEHLDRIERGEFGPWTAGTCGPERCLEAAYAAVEPGTGRVLALVGGRSFARSPFDRASQAQRQPGSAFKPFVYAAALDAGLPVSTPVSNLGQGAVDGWLPDDESKVIPVTLPEALARSNNAVAARVGDRAGLDRVEAMVRSLGVADAIPHFPTSYLGAAAVSPLRLAAGYAALAAGGRTAPPRWIDRVRDSAGNIVWEARSTRSIGVSAPVAAVMTDLLAGAVREGTGKAALSPEWGPHPAVAGKTGTTNDAKDVWFAGYTSSLAAVVWIGYDSPAPISEWASGGRLAAPLWRGVLQKAGKVPPDHWPPPPRGVELVRLDRRTGGRASTACPPEDVEERWIVSRHPPAGICPLHGR